jgi:NitT/TauT family transport system substrate-binding protein
MMSGQWMKTLGCVMGALVLTVCWGGPLAAQQKQELKPWRHGIVAAKSDAGFVMMAAKNGFAARHGINLSIVQFNSDALALRAMLAGELESYEGSPGGPMIAASRGADVKLTGCYWPVLTYGLYTKPDIKTGSDLKGKTIGISAPNALPDLFARLVLAKFNIKPDEAKFAPAGSDADRFRNLSAGIIDATASSSEFAPLVEPQGLRLLLHAHDVAPNYVRFCYYMTSKTLQDRSADAVQVLAAQMEALRYALSHREETIKLAQAESKAKPGDPRAAYVFEEVKRYSAVDPAMPIPMEKLTWMKGFFEQSGSLQKPLDLAKFVSPAAREQALAAASGGR